MAEAWVVGAGPAGLMAAEELARAGWDVHLAEAKPTPARKFLMAGKSGLNLTKDEPLADFLAAYDAPQLAPMLAAFGPEAVQAWARDLGIAVFTGSSGRVFPREMKASPLLRAWLARLAGLGVRLHGGWRWLGFGRQGQLGFDTPEGPRQVAPERVVLALGGASWPRLGSDGAWVPWLAARGVAVAPFRPANMGFRIAWSPKMSPHFGAAVKNVALTAGALRRRGEFVITAKGVEGGGIYLVARDLARGETLWLDLLPDLTAVEVAARLAAMRPGESLANRLRKLGLSPASQALAMEFGRALPPAQAVKALPIGHQGPLPLAEAISSAGGVAWGAVTPELELTALPGIFVAGEMLDWEAPTGGYLLTACLATGRWAGRAAARR